MTTTILIIIGAVLVIAFIVYFFYCKRRNYSYFLKHLHEGQTVFYGDEGRLGQIKDVYTDSVLLCDKDTLEVKKVPLTSLNPL